MAAICKHYFENPDKGGGKIEEFKWDNIEHIFYIKFADAKVAKQVSSSVHKIGDRQLEISLAPGGIPECVGLRTVEISGGDVDFIEVYRQYFENPVNGGGAISKIWAEEQQLFITFKDAAVAETVCCKSHTVEEHTLVAKLANMTQGTDPKRDLEHLNEEWTTVECSVGPHLREEEIYRQYFETVESGGLVEDIIINTEDRKVLVTFHSGKVARQVASGRHRIDGKDVNVQLMKTSPFYQNKLLFMNVARNVHKELLMNYMESISGQEDIQLIYSDVPGDVLVTFQNKIDFSKIREKCQTKLLSGVKLEVHRVPVSKCVIVSNLNPNTSDDEVAHYFETLGGGGVGAVLKVLPGKDNTKYIFLKDPEVAQGVATKSHRLGGRELVVQLYLTCLGPSGGKEDLYVFILPEPLELYENTDIKVCYLRHNSRILQTFNESLSTMHARAKIVENVLKVECTLNESEPNVHLLVDSWKDEVQKELGTCLDFVRLDRQDVLPEIWPEVMKAIEKCEVCGDDLLLPIPQEHAFLILSIRSKEGGTFEKIQSIVEDAEKELTFKKQEVSETKQLKKHERDILMLSSFLSDVQNQYTRLKVNIHQQEAAITFCGQLVDIRDAQRVMLETIRSASSTIMKDMPKGKMSLLANGNSHDLIQKRMISSELAATWDCHNEGVVTVFCLKESDLHRAVEVIQTSFGEETILLDKISSEVTELARWGRLKDDLMQYHRGILTISANPNTITITAFSDIMPAVKEAVENFIAQNSIYSAVFSFSPSRQKYLSTFWEERLTDITEKRSVYKVQITLDDQKRNIIVKGTKEGIQLAKKHLEKLEKRIVCTEEKITRKEIIECLVGLKNMNELEVIAKAHQCVLSLNPEETGIQLVSTNQPVKMEKQTVDRHLVSAMVADITALTVDAIVNAANDRMAHGGGIAGAIVLKGGKEIQDECYRLLKTRGKLSEGDVLVSGPGKLPCKRIIHAIGPVYKGGKCGEKERLQTAVQNCLKTASDYGYTSIALPAISSGIFGYPVDKATRDIVEAIRFFFLTNPDSSLIDVNLCDVLQDTVNLFQEALGQNSLQGKSAVIVHDSQFPLHLETTASTAAFRKLPTVSQEIKISVVEGEIAKQNVDVIVNSTSQDLNLSAGAISSSILSAAGPNLQKECSLMYPQGIPSGEIACTPSFNLACKAVFHIALCKWGDKASAKLESVVDKCLQEASRRQFSSMAIPALGTGVLGFPRDVAANTIISTVNRFQQTSPKTSLKEVKVVVFNDPATILAFRLVDSSAMKRLEAVKLSEACAANSVQDATSFKAEEEMVELLNLRLEPSISSLVYPERTISVSEAKSSDSDVSVSLGGLHVTIKQGDITEEHVDAIVNSSNTKLDLTRGAVSTILKAKCGEALELECSSKLADMVQHKTVVTAAHNLKCKHIVHLDALFYRQLSDWEKAYTAVLQEADKIGLSSLAVPALGTGTLGLSASDSAQALAKAIVTRKQTWMTLQRVAVVLYDSPTVRTFTEVLRREENQDTVQTLSSKDKDVRKKSIFQRAKEKLGCIFKPKRDPVPDVLKLYIFAASHTKTEEFRKYLYEFVDAKYENKEINDLERLSPEEFEEIEEMCKSFKVELQKNAKGAVVLKGMSEDVERTREMIRVLVKEQERQHQEDVMANVVQWCFFQEKATGTERKAFGKRENLLIEEAYQTFQKDQKKDSVEISLEEDDAFVVHFTENKIYSKLNPSDGLKIMRREIIKDGVSSVSLLPEEWEFHEEEEDAVKLVNLVNGCDEYKTVHENFSRTAEGTFSILSIQRIQNSVLYKQYMAKKDQMDKQNKGMESEKILWHGTSLNAIQYINRYGFDRSFCGKNATWYGQGVYFAVNSSYSMDPTYSTADSLGQKYIYQCKVLVGHSTKGSKETKTLPIRQGEIKYDSATNDEKNPQMYVIFHDSQAYPEYLITLR
ncbi:poly [ADP-ribose] polymerase 14-like isoform X2 [Pomacea canaliculata]|nr:poly [ADP-ribose] polymerase 14-like isoform X2 [Pomacea canaliculata]XP_025094888.1 poly [ADP-ribose] polymerase 14-like isoform X2 [Pomacea canaliculata]